MTSAATALRSTGLTISAWILALALATTGAAAAQLAGSEWRPTEIRTIEVPAGAEIFVRFGDGGKLVGNGGCNRFVGTYKLIGDAIEFGRLGVTRKACPDPVMKSEGRFLRALASARRFVRDRAKLSLADDVGNPVMRLIQTDPD